VIAPSLQRLYARAPVLQRLARRGVYVLREALAAGMTHDHALLRVFELIARAQLRVQVRDRVMRAQLPHRLQARAAVKRLVSDADRARLRARHGADRRGARARDRHGGRRAAASRLDHLRDRLQAHGPGDRLPPARGHGQLLSDVWNGSPQAYLGTVVSGFPNLFMLYGPNLNLGHSSIVDMLESQIHYTLRYRRIVDRLNPGDYEIQRAPRPLATA